MIQHVVLINFRHGVPDTARGECVTRLRELAALIPGLRAWRVGTNTTNLHRAWDLAVTGEFDAVEDVYAYRAHPAHRAAQEFVDSMAAETVGVDFEVAP